MKGSADDPDIDDAITIFGSDGYYIFFRTLEILAQEFDPNTPGEITVSREFFRKKFRVSWQKVVKVLSFYHERERIFHKFLDDKRLPSIWLHCPKYQELTDEYSKKLLKKMSGQTPDSCLDKVRVEEEVEEEVDKDNNINNKREEKIYPDWIPKNTFLEYQNQRKKKIKPQSLNRFFNSLKKICDETKASPEEILNQSIVNGWEGIFPLKENKNANTSFRPNSYRKNNNDRQLDPDTAAEIERIAESLRAK